MTALDGRFENRSERNGWEVAGFSKRPLSAWMSRFSFQAICLAGSQGTPESRPVKAPGSIIALQKP
jgi:hypothetical protein